MDSSKFRWAKPRARPGLITTSSIRSPHVQSDDNVVPRYLALPALATTSIKWYYFIQVSPQLSGTFLVLWTTGWGPSSTTELVQNLNWQASLIWMSLINMKSSKGPSTDLCTWKYKPFKPVLFFRISIYIFHVGAPLESHAIVHTRRLTSNTHETSAVPA